ncbi:MAG: hypothetical protein JSS66_07235 [Armatimonadetes bacterium]|nr:hypothetical protein [Armatimonadota bacterium]
MNFEEVWRHTNRLVWAMSEFDYPEQEFYDSLRRAFTGSNAADYITFDGHVARNKFLRQCIQWGVDNDVLYEDKTTSELLSDSQWTVQAFRLTDRGKDWVVHGKYRLDLPQSKLDRALEGTI